jgi:hypothetical protein
VVTIIIMVLLAGYLLTRSAADFAKAEPRAMGDERQLEQAELEN